MSCRPCLCQRSHRYGCRECSIHRRHPSHVRAASRRGRPRHLGWHSSRLTVHSSLARSPCWPRHVLVDRGARARRIVVVAIVTVLPATTPAMVALAHIATVLVVALAIVIARALIRWSHRPRRWRRGRFDAADSRVVGDLAADGGAVVERQREDSTGIRRYRARVLGCGRRRRRRCARWCRPGAPAPMCTIRNFA